MRVGEIRSLADQELAKQLEEAHRELFSLRFRVATRQLVNHREICRVKKKIARMLTVQRERELAQA
ncbi:MAG: 50S ribosomal protein L29 [Chloroflexi bacterium RBG_13_54_8]|nr:MAG: 50S ribosomal protein L29 [Chloroflexi bacterium RBG_13_54_8]